MYNYTVINVYLHCNKCVITLQQTYNYNLENNHYKLKRIAKFL